MPGQFHLLAELRGVEEHRVQIFFKLLLEAHAATSRRRNPAWLP